jgi:predicted RNase H-like nuclease (RuvC/YqgF family)
MFKTLEKIKNWVVGIFAIIGGIAVVYALKNDSRSEKEFKSDMKKLEGAGVKVDKKIATREEKVTKLNQQLSNAKKELTNFKKEGNKIKKETKSTKQKFDYLTKLANKGK